MSRIEKLIEELCPKGVELKELVEVSSIFDGTHQTPRYTDKGIKFVSVENIKNLYSTIKHISIEDYENLYKNKPQKNDVFMTRIGTIGVCAINDRDEELAYYVTLTLIRPNQEVLNSNFLKYAIESSNGQKELKKRTLINAVPIKINLGEISKIQIPIPPLPIQQEIVTILDTFTELDAQLQAEFEARRKQYEHYRNELLSFEGKEVEWKTLGEVGKFIRGKRFVKNDIVSEGVPCIHYGEMYTFYKTWTNKTKSFLKPEKAEKLRLAKPGDVIIVTAGETIEDIGNAVAWLGETNVVIHDACFAYSHNFNPKFVSYYFQTDLFRSQIRKHISSSKISAILESGLRQAKIPIPPLADQQRIVEILDKFDSLVSYELPAEIAARRKQYEYYREKLLTFKPLTTNP